MPLLFPRVSLKASSSCTDLATRFSFTTSQGERNETGEYVAVDMVDHATRQLLDSPFLRTLAGMHVPDNLVRHLQKPFLEPKPLYSEVGEEASYGNVAFWLMCVCVCLFFFLYIALKGEVERTKGDLRSTLHQNRNDGVRLHCAFFYKARWMLETFHHGNLENIRIVIETRQGEHQIPESIETAKVLVSVDELPLPVGTYLLSKLIRFFRISPSSDKVLGRKPNPRRPRPTKRQGKLLSLFKRCLV